MTNGHPGKPVRPLGFRRYAVNYLGLLPFFALFVAFVLIPLVQGVLMSFTDWSTKLRGGTHFTGLTNYIYILTSGGTSSQRFLKSIVNLLIYVPTTVTIGLAISLILALIVNQFTGRQHGFFRGSFFVPTVLPLFLCTGIWQWYLNSETGLVASTLARIGIGNGVTWSQTPGYAIAVCVIIDIWHAVGFNFVIMSAGIQDISPDYYEAAEIDGATTWQQMRYITLPLLEPILFFVITYAFISALQVYDIPRILTQDTNPNSIGGPNQVMLFPVMEMVRNLHSGDKAGLGRACCEGVMLMFMIMGITAFQFRRRKKKI
jgi:multiple sugar transport system permease protein